MSRTSRRSGLPLWTRDVDRVLGRAGAAVRLLARSTPPGFVARVAEAARAWVESGPTTLQCDVAPAELGGLDLELERLADRLDREGELGALYAARAREISLEARIAEALGTPRVVGLAKQRFGPRDAFDVDADVVASGWLEEPRAPGDDGPRVRSDDEADPRSLVSRMRGEIGLRKLPIRVIVAKDLGALAAAGDGLVLVAAGRSLGEPDVERTVCHEIEGHLVPGLRGKQQPLGVFVFGTARGSDDQEGWALTSEERHGHLRAARRRELAFRHIAAREVQSGAGFVDVTERLLRCGASVDDAVRIAARSARGGGLAREAVYLGAWLRVRAALAEAPELELTLTSGRVSVEAARLFREAT
jgi:hypothetical protein